MSGLDRICHARVDPNVLLMYVDKGATVYRTAGVGRLILLVSGAFEPAEVCDA